MTDEEKKAEQKKRDHEYYLKHAEYIKERQKEYYQKHKDEILENMRNDSNLRVKRKERYDREKANGLLDKLKNERKENGDHLREKERERYWKDPEHFREKNKKYRENNKDQIREYQIKRYQENKEKLLQDNKQYMESPGKYDHWIEKIGMYYESEQIRRDPDNPDLIQIKCYFHECNNWANPTNRQLYDRYRGIVGISRGENNIYCSEECKEKCPAYKLGFDPKKKIAKIKVDVKKLRREVQPELREMVLERDNYTCQREGCEKSLADFPDLKLHCHHIKPINEDPICSADIDNCITLCEECHRWIHMNVPGCSYYEMRCHDNGQEETEQPK